MELTNRRRPAARFPGIFPASRPPGIPLGDLGKFAGKSAPRAGKITGFELIRYAADQILYPNKLIPRVIISYFPLIGYYYA